MGLKGKNAIRVRVESLEALRELSERIGVPLKAGRATVDIRGRSVVKYSENKAQRPDIDGQAMPAWGGNGMPYFYQSDVIPLATIDVLRDGVSLHDLSEVFSQKVTDKTKSLRYPKQLKSKDRLVWVSEEPVLPRYPLYVISKGRAVNCLTSKALSRMAVPHFLVVEPSEAVEYYEALEYSSSATILVCPEDFSALECGSIPVRNYVHSIASREAAKYWILDDNIEDFNRLYMNSKHVVRSGAAFRALEDFTGLYSNIGQAGLNYYSFCKAGSLVPPFYLNTRIYSCILMRSDIDPAWRGRYNEDTDLSIRLLKRGYCTVLFNSFLAGKVTTMRMRGGNTDTVYTDGDNRRKFAESLVAQHSDIVKLTTKFNRYHHHVNYSGFTQELEPLDPNATRPHDEYGLYIKSVPR